MMVKLISTYATLQ